jgi:hypothetical protein
MGVFDIAFVGVKITFLQTRMNPCPQFSTLIAQNTNFPPSNKNRKLVIKEHEGFKQFSKIASKQVVDQDRPHEQSRFPGPAACHQGPA